MLSKGFQQFTELLIDSYFVVDLNRNIVDFNRAFFSMVPRQIARKLKSMKCYEVLRLDICAEHCIAQECWKAQRHVRLDEITGVVAGQEDERLRFILSCIPVRDEAGNIIGAIEMQRNVTDEAIVQSKYQQQIDASSQELEKLQRELKERTRRVLDLSRQLSQHQLSLLRAKTELFG